MFEVTDNLGLTLLHRMDEFDTELLMLNLKKIDTAYGTSLNNITDAFDSTKEYAIGDYCIKDNVLYKFVSAKSVGDWDDSIVISTTISNVLKEINAEITQLNSKIDNHIMIRSVNSTVYSLPPHGHAEIKINIPNVDGYKALIGFYSGNSVNTSILPFTTSNIPNSDGNLIFGAYNTANETMGNVIFVVNILYVKL